MTKSRRAVWAPAVVVLLAATATIGCAGDPVVRTELAVDGMHCDGCEEGITEELIAIEGVETVEADWETGRVIVRHHERTAPTDALVADVESLGYTVHGTKTEPVDA
jgi:copper chaperone